MAKSKMRCFLRNKTDTSADLYIYGDIVSDEGDKWSQDDKCPTDVANALKECVDAEQLNIYINSCGGDVFSGNAIYNIISRHKAHKTVYIDGLAASIASVIALAGNEIIMPSNAYLMIHKAWTLAVGNSNELRQTADRLDEIEKSIVDIYMKNAADGTNEADIIQKMSDETWLNASDAAALFPKIRVETELKASACVTDFTFSDIPKGVKIKNSDEGEPDNGKSDKKMANNIGLELMENFIFTERTNEDE